MGIKCTQQVATELRTATIRVSILEPMLHHSEECGLCEVLHRQCQTFLLVQGEERVAAWRSREVLSREVTHEMFPGKRETGALCSPDGDWSRKIF